MKGFDGLMLSNVWNGLQLKKEKSIKNMPLYVQRVDGGVEKVVFQQVEEFKLPNEYTLVGTCEIDNKPYSFEYVAPFGLSNGTVIGFNPLHELEEYRYEN